MNILSIKREKLYRALVAVGIDTKQALKFSTVCIDDVILQYLDIVDIYNKSIDGDCSDEVFKESGLFYKSSITNLYFFYKDEYLNLA